MVFSIQVARSVTEISRTVWDELSGDRPFTSYQWYYFGEKALFDCSPVYILLSQNDKPVARASFWFKHQEWLPIASPILRFGAEKLLQRYPLMMCATPLVCVPALVLPDSSARPEALRTIAETAMELGKKENASFSFFSYLSIGEIQQAGWPRDYSAITFSDAETSLEIAWPDFESYLRHLAKSTRRNHKLHSMRATELGVTVASRAAIADFERAIKLIENVEQYHRVGHRPWTRAFLENIGLADDFTWITAHIGDRLVGCCAIVGERGAQIATLLGLDYSIPDFTYIYYQIIYAAIRSAIEHGAKILYGGGGAYEFKRRLGFRMLPDDYLEITALKKPLRGLLRGMTGRMRVLPIDPESNESSRTAAEVMS
jgi:predicted N-acyltransferase